MGNNCAAAVYLSIRRHGIGLAITDVACDGTLMADCIAMHRGVRFSRFQSAVYQWCAAVNSDCVNVVKTRRLLQHYKVLFVSGRHSHRLV